jgi:hypothetical protein
MGPPCDVRLDRSDRGFASRGISGSGDCAIECASQIAMLNGLDDESFPYRARFPCNSMAPTRISRRNAMTLGGITLGGSMRLNVLALVALVALGAKDTVARADDFNDYPTVARSEYVFGCLKANGETRQAIDQCSCSIDVIASLLPYDRYVTAETVLSMAQVQGNLGGQFRSSEQANSALNDLRRAQAEAEVRCF